VSPEQVALDVVEHQVHQREAVGVVHELDAVEGVAALEDLLLLRQLEEVVGRAFLT
jgi:hypothetical protein